MAMGSRQIYIYFSDSTITSIPRGAFKKNHLQRRRQSRTQISSEYSLDDTITIMKEIITWAPTFKGIISIFQSYFTKKYLGIRVQMKAIDLPFQMSYGSLIYSKGLHCDRSKC